jgi:hypothetical protein
MKAVTLIQTGEFMESIAYLAGVLNGDGYISNVFGLNVKDKEFSEAFSKALEDGFGYKVLPKQDKRGMWIVRKGSRTGQFDFLRTYGPETENEKGRWLRGLFDSEGNAMLLQLKKVGENSYHRRVSIYSTNFDTLTRAGKYFSDLGINYKIHPTKNSKSHRGSKVVFELALCGSQQNYARFYKLVGSSIPRKQDVLEKIPASYRPDISEHCRQIQLKGAKTKFNKTMTTTLPVVIQGIKRLINDGIKPTQRACRIVPGYNSIQRYFPQEELIVMAKEVK